MCSCAARNFFPARQQEVDILWRWLRRERLGEQEQQGNCALIVERVGTDVVLQHAGRLTRPRQCNA